VNVAVFGDTVGDSWVTVSAVGPLMERLEHTVAGTSFVTVVSPPSASFAPPSPSAVPLGVSTKVLHAYGSQAFAGVQVVFVPSDWIWYEFVLPVSDFVSSESLVTTHTPQLPSAEHVRLPSEHTTYSVYFLATSPQSTASPGFSHGQPSFGVEHRSIGSVPESVVSSCDTVGERPLVPQPMNAKEETKRSATDFQVVFMMTSRLRRSRFEKSVTRLMR
jgi:hypothetical protein